MPYTGLNSKCYWPHRTSNTEDLQGPATLMLLMATSYNTKSYKNLKNDWNPGKWVLIWEYSERASQWIPTWQGLNGFQKSFCPCSLKESSLSIKRVKEFRLQQKTFGSMILKRITLEFRRILQNIRRKVAGLIKFSSSIIFLSTLLPARFHCQLSGCFWPLWAYKG